MGKRNSFNLSRDYKIQRELVRNLGCGIFASKGTAFSDFGKHAMYHIEIMAGAGVLIMEGGGWLL